MFKKLTYLILSAAIFMQCDFENDNTVELKPQVGSVSSINISDIGSTNTSSDLSISFIAPNDESSILEYQLVVVAIDEFEEISLNTVIRANNSAFYRIPVQGDYTDLTLDASISDISNNPLLEEVNYIAFILSVSNDNSLDSKLSTNSNVFKLSNKATPVSNVTVLDIGNFNSTEDINITFQEPVNNSSIGGYRLFITNADFNMTAEIADQADEDEYIAVDKGEGNYSLSVPVGLQTVDGSVIEEDSDLAVHILSLPDGQAAEESSISNPIPFTLLNESFIKTVATNLKGNGGIIVANNGKIVISNLGTLESPNGQGFSVYDPFTETLDKTPTSFRGTYGGAAWGTGVYMATASEPNVLFYDLADESLSFFFSGNPLETPTDVATLGGTRFFADCDGLFEVRVSSFTGNFELTSLQPSSALLRCPINLEFNSSGNAFVLNRASADVLFAQNIFADNTLSTLVTLPDIAAAISYSPERDRLYAITQVGKIYEINYRTQSYELIAGSDGTVQDGLALQAGILRPYYLAVSDLEDAIYFTDLETIDGDNEAVILKKFQFKR
ncbi:MAG: hypothetical protein NXI20_27710 [bacterium]|nr:hypothetical protein [bacterium]